MLKRWIALSLLGFFLATGVAAAQTSNKGVFDKLSPGNQKIARSLYDAQTSKKLSLDDVAAMKRDGQGWGEVFKQMKSQGLVQEKNLGEVVSRSNHPGEAGATTTTGSGKSHGVGNKGKPEGSTSSPRRGFKSEDGERGNSGATFGGNGQGNGFGRGGGVGGGQGHGGGRGK